MNFINPIENGYITSNFGPRKIGGVQDYHKGVDLSHAPNTNVKVLAAADGEVIRVGPLSTYGNVVMIKHSINGKRMDTNYAHLASYNVKVGDKVKQGQVIGIMGNTGGSKANPNYKMAIHLHFEIHNGAWAAGQPNAVDPSKYIKFYTKSEVQKMEKMQKEIEALKTEVTTLKDSIATLHIRDKEKNKDVVAADWAKEDIEFAKKLDVGGGQMLTDGTYLNSPVTRQEVIVIAVRTIRHIKAWVQSVLNLK